MYLCNTSFRNPGSSEKLPQMTGEHCTFFVVSEPVAVSAVHVLLIIRRLPVRIPQHLQTFLHRHRITALLRPREHDQMAARLARGSYFFIKSAVFT